MTKQSEWGTIYPAVEDQTLTGLAERVTQDALTQVQKGFQHPDYPVGLRESLEGFERGVRVVSTEEFEHDWLASSLTRLHPDLWQSDIVLDGLARVIRESDALNLVGEDAILVREEYAANVAGPFFLMDLLVERAVSARTGAVAQLALGDRKHRWTTRGVNEALQIIPPHLKLKPEELFLETRGFMTTVMHPRGALVETEFSQEMEIIRVLLLRIHWSGHYWAALLNSSLEDGFIHSAKVAREAGYSNETQAMEYARAFGWPAVVDLAIGGSLDDFIEAGNKRVKNNLQRLTRLIRLNADIDRQLQIQRQQWTTPKKPPQRRFH